MHTSIGYTLIWVSRRRLFDCLSFLAFKVFSFVYVPPLAYVAMFSPPFPYLL